MFIYNVILIKAWHICKDTILAYINAQSCPRRWTNCSISCMDDNSSNFLLNHSQLVSFTVNAFIIRYHVYFEAGSTVFCFHDQKTEICQLFRYFGSKTSHWWFAISQNRSKKFRRTRRKIPQDHNYSKNLIALYLLETLFKALHRTRCKVSMLILFWF